MITEFELERRHNTKNGVLVEGTIRTRVPNKWRFVDLETGDVWALKLDGSFTRSEYHCRGCDCS